MVKFIIVRHGYSLANKGRIFTGQLDVSLDEVGYEQAELVGKYVLENFSIDEVYSSALSRAYDTALPLAKVVGKEVKMMKELNEVDVGLWGGKTFEEAEKEFPENYKRYIECPGLSYFDGGERYVEARERICLAFEKIAAENEGKTVMVVAHGGVLRNLFAAWQGILPERLTDVPRLSNASITVAEYDNENKKANILLYGYTGHLEKLKNKGIERALT